MTLASVAAVAILAQTPLAVPNPPALLLLAVVYAAFSGGIASGLFSAVVVWVYFAYFFSLPGHPFTFTAENARRVLIWAFATPGIAVMVGQLKRRLEGTLKLQFEERRQSDQELQTSGHLIQSILATAHDAFISMDPEGRITDWNAQAEATFSWKKAEVLGRLLAEILVPPEYRQAHAKGLERFLATGHGPVLGQRLEMKALHRDGREIPVEMTISAVRQGSGYVFAAFLHDISDRLRAERQIREVEERERLLQESEFRTVFDLAATGVAQLEPVSGRFLRVNPKLTELTGHDAATLSESTIQALTHPEDQEAVAAKFESLVAGREVNLDYEQRLLRKDGEVVWATVTATVIRDGAGAALRVIAIFQDVTERRATEADQRFLAEASRVLSSLDYQTNLTNLAHLAVPRLADLCGVDIVEPNGEIKRLAVAHQSPAKVELATRLRELYPLEANASAGVEYVIRTGKTELYSHIDDAMLCRIARDERQLAIFREIGLVSLMSVPLEHGGKVLGSLTMVSAESGRHFTERDLAFAGEVGRRAAMAIENAKTYRESVATNRMKDEFLATLSHELRTPLNSIVGWTDLIRAHELPPNEVADAIEIIHRNAHAQVQLITDLLDVSRIITGKLEIENRTVDLMAVAANASAAVRLAAQAKSIQLTIEPAEGEAMVQGDPGRLQQVIWNLLTNAIKFTPKGGRIELKVSALGPSVDLSLADSGEGIDTAFLPFVFDRFRQEDSSVTRRHGGLGLGLAIVRHIVEAHGGTVRVASAGRGKGSTFVLSLPRAAAPVSRSGASLSAPLSPASATQGRLAGLEVLVVDDDSDARHIVAKILKNHGATVREADNAIDALHLAKDHDLDVIISDVGMPEVDGYELVRRLRASPNLRIAEIPAVALTAYAREEERAKALTAGFGGHLAKPVSYDELVEWVATHGSRPGAPPA